MLRVFKNLTKKEIGFMLLGVTFIVLQVWLELAMPDYMSKITLLVQTEGSQMGEILLSGAKMLLCALGSLICSIMTAVCAARIATNFGANLRHKLFGRVQAFSMEEIGAFSTASLITRSTNDVTHVQILIVMGLQVIIKAPITAGWAIAKIAGKGKEWTFSTAVAVAILLLVVGICIIVALPKFKQLQALTDDLNRVTRENVNGIRVIRAYNAEEYQENKFGVANNNLFKTQLFTSHTLAFMLPGIQLVMSGLTLAVYWIGSGLINAAGAAADKALLFSNMVVFAQYAIQVVMSFMLLVVVFILLPRAAVSARRINEVLDKEASIQDGTVTQGVPGKEGEIVFEHVSFRYPDAEEDVLEDITFTAKKGERVAIIGATGSGKSTIINLIPRFYDVTEGFVSVDGVDVREYAQESLRAKIGYISQKAILFTGTIGENIAYGDSEKPITQEDVKRAVQTAQAADFVESREEKYDAYVSQGGGNLSGGQKQRLSIARAIARRPEILIFDDSFSALDYKTDRQLRNCLREQCADSTQIIVAQRIGTIRDADRILVVDDGKIVGQGTHEQLMASCEVYQQIALSQLSEEELK